MLVVPVIPTYLFVGALIVILYGYVAYPLLLAVLALVYRQRYKKEACYPTVTLLVAAYNEEEVIEEKISNSLALDYPPERLTIVVASDGSDDQTNKIVRSFSPQGVVLKEFRPRRGKIAVLNRILPLLHTDIVIFSDANTMYHPSAVKMLVRNFADPSVGVVSGDVILLNNHVSFGEAETLYYKYERFIQEKESETGSIIGADGAMYAIRRELYVPPADNTILDDFVISMNVAKQGKRIVYEPDARGYEHSAPNLKEEFLRKVRIAAGAVQSLRQRAGVPEFRQGMLLFKYCSHKVLRWGMPVCLLTLFASNVLLLGEPLYQLFFIMQCCFYLLAVWGVFSRGVSWLATVPSYFCMANIAAAVGIYRGMLGRESVTWRRVARERGSGEWDAK